MNIFLIGYRCSGKTTTGEILAKMLNLPFVDSDQEVEKKWKLSIYNMINSCGWEEFRKREKQVFRQIVKKKHQVISTGGGIVLDSDNRKIISDNGFGVFLKADAKTVVDRFVQDNDVQNLRPRFSVNVSLMDETILAIESRQAFYRECASLILDSKKYSPQELARQIVNLLEPS